MGSTEDLTEFELREKFCEDNREGNSRTSLDMSQQKYYHDDDLYLSKEATEVDHCLEKDAAQEVQINVEGKEEALPEDQFQDSGDVLECQAAGVTMEPTPEFHCDMTVSEEFSLNASLHVEESVDSEVEAGLDGGSSGCLVPEANRESSGCGEVDESVPYSVENISCEYSEGVSDQFLGTDAFQGDLSCDYSFTKPDLVPCCEVTAVTEAEEVSTVDKNFTNAESDIETDYLTHEECLISPINDRLSEEVCVDQDQLSEERVDLNLEVDSKDFELNGFKESSVEKGQNVADVQSFHDQEIKQLDAGSQQQSMEDTPLKKEDIARESDLVEEVMCLKKGFAKDLAGFWSSPKNGTCTKQVRSPIELPRDDEPFIVENSPQKLEGVVRSDDIADNDITIEQGHAKMMVNLFQTKKDQNVTKELKLDINFEEPGVYENNPKEREGIVKSSDVIDDIQVKKGVIKMITGKFESKEDAEFRPREVIKIEPAQGPSVIENTPEPPMADVIRSDSKVEDGLPSLQGFTKNLVQKWKTNDLINSKPNTNKTDDLEAILKAGMAAESGVFENQPSIRADVVREDDGEPDIIPAQKTKTTRDLWNQKINQESRPAEKSPQLVRFTPPRERSPPIQADDSFKSFQQITLA